MPSAFPLSPVVLVAAALPLAAADKAEEPPERHIRDTGTAARGLNAYVRNVRLRPRGAAAATATAAGAAP